jgi:subtilisin family serine protease
MKLLLALALALTAGLSWADGDTFVVTFHQGVSPSERKELLAQRGLQLVEDLDPLPAAVVKDSPQSQAFGGPHGLLSLDSRVLNIEEDFYADWLVTEQPASVYAVPIPAFADIPRPDLKAPEMGQEQIPWGISRVGAPQAWERTKGAGVKVAVIDTGIGPNDDVQVEGGYNASLFSNDWRDDNGHGTHVAGTIAARLNGKGVVGVAPEARLYAVKVLNGKGGGMATSIVKGISWAVKNNMNVVNMSLGSPRGLFIMHWAIMLGKLHKVTFVVAAGNSGREKPGEDSVEYPGAYPEVIAVAASDSSDHIADFSSRGKEVSFIAPGVNVLSTLPGNKFEAYNGTSMATPHVTGLAALAVSLGADGPEQVKGSLTRAARPLLGLSKDEQGAGMIDASKL